jgi:hypothetical protein
MRIYPIFHKSLLEPADPDTPLNKETQIQGYNRPNITIDELETEYEVESIINHTVVGC